ncbi:tetratricopeptide repeat protein [Lacibacterium aquatile]|uniref:Tetratricopeptide repeat protein n=1 Tax=Lacibacterium aquatile TaxID=1168082 RepID=A0ABW5DYE9_9PROT
MKVVAAALVAVVLAGVPGAGFAMGAVGQPTPAKEGSTEQGSQLAKDGKFKEAIAVLTGVVEKTPTDVEAHNMLGFSYRSLKDYPMAATHYRAALSLDPRHKGALNYYGELFLSTGDLTSAQEMLDRLVQVCPSGCAERDELAAHLAKAKGAS